jgi:hypothetical protein
VVLAGSASRVVRETRGRVSRPALQAGTASRHRGLRQTRTPGDGLWRPPSQPPTHQIRYRRQRIVPPWHLPPDADEVGTDRALNLRAMAKQAPCEELA